MSSSFSLILRDNRIRIPAVTLVALAFTYASTAPYQSIIGINELGLSDGAYSALVFFSAIVNVVTSLTLGIWSDRLKERRPLVLSLSVAGMLGFGSIALIHSPAIFIFSTLLLVPMSNSTYSLLFASLRARTNQMERGQGAAVTATVRALFSGSWALAPGLIGLYLANSSSMTPAYGIAAIASCICFCLYFFFAPGNGTAGPAPDPVGFVASLKRVFMPNVLIRVVVMAMLFGLQRLNAMLLPLIITHAAGGSVVDVGFIAGLTALLEMPFMMMWGMAQRRFRTAHVLAFGALIYCAYLLLLGFASTPWHIYALLLLNACGAAAILSVPITYLQDLIADRPGLGTSLISLNTFIGTGIAAGLFALGTSLTDYSGTAFVGASAGVAAIAALLYLESERRQARQPA
ncbi:MFS transporter [Rhizobium bangladeshense]|uniref:MFS transporter n=1 Tax=Rhizobium bangladeshense TaxID=1138189 RepID=A0ABS7LMA7_9HYPH|nr:MFS transporter [Rhizobium bangladeshense]MBX4869363.1 MFS transporter [Rhizobium bangladeshense]MBX4885202.1 MFS transporter [Rhizobium bangladeshense]MBX4897115.1 MFS transporter [Rhizobium bangladeshense]MBX4902523.1 MFS transporter [Rhizobium bangladeshense]MBY3592612.1 MFS transporter [Rhizobium bangladeshense]